MCHLVRVGGSVPSVIALPLPDTYSELTPGGHSFPDGPG